jgi:Steroid receptor RNA activator (SRA1)
MPVNGIPFLQLRACEEMDKKVTIFSDMWKNGKISYPVKSAMARLATGVHLSCR